MAFSQFSFVLFASVRVIRTSQSDADHGNWNGCQLITQKQGNSSNSLEFKEIYPYCRIMQYICNTQMAKQGIFQEKEEKNADFYVYKTYFS